jgi:hypothetical protein
MRIAFEHTSQNSGCRHRSLLCPAVAEEDREFQIKEERMAEHQPSKAGEYERPTTRTSRSLALMLGGIALLVLIIVAILFLR